MDNSFIDSFLLSLSIGDGSVINSENTAKLNQLGLDLYAKPELDGTEVEALKKLIMSCNILYNRTDMLALPIEDGFYDLLLEKYKNYDEHFQVGSAVVNFKENLNNIGEHNRQVKCPISFIKKRDLDPVHQEAYDNIMQLDKTYVDGRDFHINPLRFESDYISKRTHNTEHNHPDLVGTLDKAKFVLNQDAIDAGVFDDANVKVFERDFFADHIQKGILDPNKEFGVVCELKYDGISVEADCGLELFSARTRGDTGIGEASDLTPMLRGYTFKHADCMIGEKPIGVKFEAIMTKSNLCDFNIANNYNYANCRTAIVGLFGSSDAYKYRDYITLIPLAVDRNDVPQISNRMEEIEFLNRVFISNGEPLRYCYFYGTYMENLYNIKAFWDEAKVARDYLNFMYDGIVVSYTDEDIRQKLGRKNYINKYSMAIKFDPAEKLTIFRGYTFEVGQHGNITPMIHYDPVEFIGTIHTKSSGSSYERFKSMGLKYGDYINVKYVNDVMPYVSTVDCDSNRNNPSPVYPFIEHCPICGTKLVISESGKSAICPNMECLGRSVTRMTNMFAKLNIKGFGDSTFNTLSHIDHFYKLFEYDEAYYISTLGDADGRSMYKVLNELTTKPIKDYIIMGSLGFQGLAHKKWQAILQKISIKELYNRYISDTINFKSSIYTEVISSGIVTLTTIVSEFPFFIKDIEFIVNHMNIIDYYNVDLANRKQIRFTGCRDQQLAELLCNAGYDADDSSVTKKTDILLIPYKGFVSGKVTKAPQNCMIVPIADFKSNMEFYLGEKV